jgi:hypothetical protein
VALGWTDVVSKIRDRVSFRLERKAINCLRAVAVREFIDSGEEIAAPYATRRTMKKFVARK